MKPSTLILGGTALAAVVFIAAIVFIIVSDSVNIVFTNGTATTTTIKTTTHSTSITTVTTASGRIDDWQYDPNQAGYDYQVKSSSSGGGLIQRAANYLGGGVPMMEASKFAGAPSDLGFSVGGAKDVNNFRENIENDYLPLPTDITYEGLYYDYYFDTGKTEECGKLFCPSYSSAVSNDPFSGKPDYYLQVGLNSGLKKEDFSRKKLNLVIVLDISGSMSSSFNRYYYDRFGRRIENKEMAEEETGKSKMEVATESIVALIDHLDDDDRLGIVLFDNYGYLAKPMNRVGDIDVNTLKGHILELSPQGGTHMSAGMKLGTDQFSELLDVDQAEYENRIIFLTDAMPNIGDTTEEGLLGITEKNSKNRLYSTFIGIGVDFNTELIEYITKIRGANYYSVHSSKQFKERMDDQFEYMVTPLVFNLKLELEADGYEILKVYGSPEADEATGEIMKVNTLFPSETKDGETKGGIIVLKLRKTAEDAKIRLRASYEDREGNKDYDEKTITFEDKSPDHYGNDGLRKGILLARYADLMKNWINDERGNLDKPKPIPLRPVYEYHKVGIMCPPRVELGEWERQSVSLRVSKAYMDLFDEFQDYFEDEMDELDDETLEQEVDVLEKLAEYSGKG
ncbi:MAG: VWA domain-containing protein [Candidatus Altiarchaeota archaeon]